MTRDLTAGVQSAIQLESTVLVHLLALEFAGGTLYLTTGPQTITATVPYPDGTTAAHDFSAIGGTCGFGPVTEGIAAAEGATQMVLSAVDQTVIAALLTDHCLGRSAYIWRAYLDASTWAVVSEPALLFLGKLNGDWTCSDERPEDIRQPGKATIVTRLLDDFGDFDTVRGIQTSLASHQATSEQATPATTEASYADDTFFQYVAQMAWKRCDWGGSLFAMSPSLPYQQRGGAATAAERGSR